MLRDTGNILKVGYLLLPICFWLVLPALVQAQGQYDGAYGSGANPFILATGSPGELGLLKALGEAYATKENATLLWKKAGSGEALKLLKEKRWTPSWSTILMGRRRPLRRDGRWGAP